MRKHIYNLRKRFLPYIIGLSLFIVLPLHAQTPKKERALVKIEKKTKKWRQSSDYKSTLGKVNVDSVRIDKSQKQINLYFSKNLSSRPIREAFCNEVRQSYTRRLGKKYAPYTVNFYTDRHLLQELVPNIFRTEIPVDKSRVGSALDERIPLVRRLDGFQPSKGLYNCNLAVWHSHGLYYEASLDRWEYQRARLFGSVEDLSPMGYVLPYLAPMLENAGANVFLPRERDIQSHEVIVDKDLSTGKSELTIPSDVNYDVLTPGFLKKDTIFGNENPFKLGTSLRFSLQGKPSEVWYVPEIPEEGEYAVYISFNQDSLNNSDVLYTVHHAGGSTRFLVNQKIGGGTWVYLGTFLFKDGKNSVNAAVSVAIPGNSKGTISLDAVKFGGGMGNVARRPADKLIPRALSVNDGKNASSPIKDMNPENFSWKISGMPRYMEGARYFLQYAGMPDTLVYSLNNNKNDYNDDYQSRGMWVNYLAGKLPGGIGLNIPMDLSLAFHTDAGVTQDESIIGTLAICSTDRDKGLFPNGQSRLASRDLSDIIQDQIVNDLRLQFNPAWTNRGLMDQGYSEAKRPEVPAMLLELLSHQNLADIKFGNDPRFRFEVSRAIYKGMLKFLAYQQGRPYVVQPLPVDHFSISRLENKTIRLSWRPVLDSLEMTAKPFQYKVYKRNGDGGFDNGTVVADTSMTLTLDEYNKIYSFRVTALNEGGESFPGEVLSVGLAGEKAPVVLVVNGFDRICAPSTFDDGNLAGISWWNDQGVPDKTLTGFCGNQYDFNRKSEWQDDDNPGWGACSMDMEGKIIPGNTFDFSKIHGEAILANGYSFISTSDEAFANPAFKISAYSMVDILMGEEKSTPQFRNPCKFDYSIYTPAFRDKLKEITQIGGSIFLSGAYIGTDLANDGDTLAPKFAKDVLHFIWRTDHASNTGKTYVTDYARKWFSGSFEYNATYNPSIYTVEAPDAIEPFGAGAVSAFRYGDTRCSAGVAYQGKYTTLVLGFPFETIANAGQRKELMHQVLQFMKVE